MRRTWLFSFVATLTLVLLGGVLFSLHARAQTPPGTGSIVQKPAPPGTVPDPGGQRPPWSRQRPGDPRQPPGAPADPQLWQPEIPGAMRPTDSITNSWTNLFPGLYAVSAVSSSEAWAAGEYGHLAHFSGGAWTDVDPPNMKGLYTADVKMLSATSGWLTSYYRAFEYDGTTWNERSAGLGTSSAYLELGLIAPLAANNVWGLGRYTPSGGSTRDTLVHWDGSQWSAAGPVLSTTVYLSNIAMAGPTDGWLVGNSYDSVSYASTPVLLRYNGTNWAPMPAPPGAGSLSNVSSNVPGEAWVTGEDTSYNSYIYHYSGGAWTAQPPPAGTSPYSIFMLNSTQGWATYSDYNNGDDGILHWDGTNWTIEYTGKHIYDLSGAGGQVWAAGPADTILSRNASGSWTGQRGGPTTNSLYSVAALTTNDAWAVGGKGTILHYTAGTWQNVVTPLTNRNDLYRVQMLTATDGYAAGSGIIAHWDGTAWTAVTRPATTLFGLAMTGSGEGWAVGSRGAIWHATGGVWSPAASPITSTLYTVAMDSPTHGWAGGGLRFSSRTPPVLLEYTGGNWVDRSAVLPAGTGSIEDLLLTAGGGEGWAVGNIQSAGQTVALLHLSGGVWSADNSSGAYYLRGLAPEALGEVWATGCSAYHRVVGAWQGVNLPTNECQDSMALVPGRGGWSVSFSGEILQYNPLAAGQRYYDVPLSNTFATFIEYMAAHNIISGYSDNTYRPSTNTTRAQLAKIVILGFNKPLVTPPAGNHTFADVLPADTFFSVIETAAAGNIVSGYTCGVAPAEPCDSASRPYFRPVNLVTRGQIAKITVIAAGWSPISPAMPTFNDVPSSNIFYSVIETVACHGAVSGYGDGTYRPGNNATRGQISKIVYLSVNPPATTCQP